MGLLRSLFGTLFQVIYTWQARSDIWASSAAEWQPEFFPRWQIDSPS